jgi:predicted HTH domain antitoxin
MQTFGIKNLQTNPAVFTNALESNEIAVITKRSKPIGVAVSFGDSILSQGLKTSLHIEAYKNGFLSLGQFCKSQDMSKEEGMKLLSLMGIDVIDYDFSDDLKSVETL